MESLLGQFYGRLKVPHEDIVSEGLTYILTRSIKARDYIRNIINNEIEIEISDLSYINQNV